MNRIRAQEEKGKLFKSEKLFRLLRVCALIFLLSSMMFAWQSIPVSYQTDSGQPVYLHSAEPLVPVHMRSNASLEPVHMDSNITLTPVHMHSLQPYQEHLYAPVWTDWHELYPNYCMDWHLTSWEDTGEPYGELSSNDQIDMTDEYGNMTWFHVDRMTITLNLSSVDSPEEKIFVEFKGPPERSIDVLYNPNCTYWHEVWSIYSNVYHIINWTDNGDGILSFCDYIDLNLTQGAIPPGIYRWHVDGVSNELILRWKMMNPICTWWHEIYPNYCGWHHLASWEDSGQPKGQLSPCDQIDMINEETGEKTWYHVDRMTVTLNVTISPEPAEWMKIELKTQYFEEIYEVLKHPNATLWHEVYPNYCNTYELTRWDWWYDDNCNGVLDVCDHIWLLNWSEPEPEEKRYHIEDISYGIILDQKIANPESTVWHGLWPEEVYSKCYNINYWEDTGEPFGFLSPCDQIRMLTPDPAEPYLWYHVDRVTLALNVSNVDHPEEFMFVELKEPFEELYLVKTHPNETLWHEVWPNYSKVYHISDWKDNCNGVLGYCDLIEFTDQGGFTSWWHVEDLAIDIVLSKKIANPVCTYWHELYPEFCNTYHVISWEDNGDSFLSPCDWVDLEPINPSGPTRSYHVQNVTLTMLVSNASDQAITMYIEFEGSFQEIYEIKTAPSGSLWHEVYPVFCRYYNLTSWEDNCDGVLSYCDIIDLTDLNTTKLSRWHIEEVAIDIVVKKKVHDVAVDNVLSLYPWVYLGKVDPIFVNVTNEGDYTENVVVYVFYGTCPCSLVAPNQTVVLIPGDTKTLTFYWDTTGFSLETYTISANAAILIDEDPGDNTHVGFTLEVRPMPPLHWKESRPDYAPSGVPDFDQRQDQWDSPPGSGVWTWCAPTAVANSLWWYDSKYEPNIIWPPPRIVDNNPLVSSYNPGVWDDHDPQNVRPFVQHLAYLMDTDGQRTGVNHVGTWVSDMQAGIAQYLSWTGVNPLGDVNGDGRVNQTDVDVVNAALGSTPGNSTWNMAADVWPVTTGWPVWGPSDNVIEAQDLALVTANMGRRGMFCEYTVQAPDFFDIEEEVERSEDVVLMLGFWNYDPGTQSWVREEYPYAYGSGHCVTAAGVNSTTMQIAVSDPVQDNAEPPPQGTNGPGRVIPTPPHPHPPAPPETVHNDASYVSQDTYAVAPVPCPSGNWTLVNYSSPQYPGWNITVIEWSITITPLPFHDVSIINVSSLFPWVYQGQIDPINVTVTNEGGLTETIDIYAFFDGNLAAPKQVVILDPRDTRTLTFNWNTTGVPVGNYTVGANATIPIDDDPADNVKTGNQQEIREPPSEIHNVSVTNVATSKTVIGQGYAMNINVTVENPGNYTETFNITAYYNATSVNTTEVTLTSGNSTTVSFTWNTTGVAKGNYTISAYAHPVPSEVDIADNNFTYGSVVVAMISDITGPEGFPDGKVEMRDVSMVARLFGVSYPDPKYNPNCDITGPTQGVADGKIEMRDVSLVARNFGKVDP